jgi:pilus assembly protein Flp/PilA
VEPRDGKRKDVGCEKNVSVVKFSRQPTDETNDGSMPGRNPRQQTPRRRKEMLTKFFVQMQNQMQDEAGQGLVEYALIIVLVSIAAIVTMRLLGTTVSGVFTTITGEL